MDAPSVISYLRDCYQWDRRGTTIWNIFDEKVEHRIVMSEEEQLINGFIPYVAVDPKQGGDAAKAAQVYEKERDLVYGAFFVTGTPQSDVCQQVGLCSPLFLYPASLHEQEAQVLLSVDLADRRLNGPLIEALCSDPKRAATVYEEMLHAMPEEIADFGAVSTLVRILKSSLPELDVDAAFRFPKLVSESALRKSVRSERGHMRLLPAAVMALVMRSVETRGVLTELSELAKESNLSPPLQCLLEGSSQAFRKVRSSQVGRVPAILSSPQREVLRGAAAQALSLVVGPPGTGKSFTIASIALEHLSRGETVLIASRTHQAVDVIANKIESQLRAEGCLIRGGRKEYLQDLKRRLDQLLHGILSEDPASELSVQQWHRRLARLDKKVASLETEIAHRNEWELKWGKFLACGSGGASQDLLSKVKGRYLDWRLSRQPLHSDVLIALYEALEEQMEVTVRSIQRAQRSRVERVLQSRRSDLMTFLRALRARRQSRQDLLFEEVDFHALLDAFPLWLVNLSDIHRMVPLRSGLFDLVVIDEATQCDMASSLPVIQRGKRAAIVGDPKQLRHLSFLSRKQQGIMAEEYGLSEEQGEIFDYREKSILDLTSERIECQGNVFFLNEHFRSLPSIIQFSNREFYDDALKIMTRTPRHTEQKAILLCHCPGGRRDRRGINEGEATLLIRDVMERVREQKDLDPATAQSIGILSPFRDQIDFIASRLNKALSIKDLAKHRIMMGTAHSFQGEERDVIFLSFALDPDSHPAAFHYLNRPDQFNVSVTRARRQQVVYASVRPDQLDGNSLLARYLQDAMEEKPAPTETQTVKDAFLRDVEQALREEGFATWPDYVVAGTQIDLVIQQGDVVRGIDLIGYPGRYENAFSLERYKMFHRAGLLIFPLSYASWMLRKEDCLRGIRQVMAPLA